MAYPTTTCITFPEDFISSLRSCTTGNNMTIMSVNTSNCLEKGLHNSFHSLVFIRMFIFHKPPLLWNLIVLTSAYQQSLLKETSFQLCFLFILWFGTCLSLSPFRDITSGTLPLSFPLPTPANVTGPVSWYPVKDESQFAIINQKWWIGRFYSLFSYNGSTTDGAKTDYCSTCWFVNSSLSCIQKCDLVHNLVM